MDNKKFDGFNSVLDNMRSSFTSQNTTVKKDKPENTQLPKEPKSQKDRDKENNVTRINLALTNDNYSFVRMMAMTKGKTVTGYLNLVIDDMRKQMQTENPELFKLSQMLFSENK